MKSNLRSHVNQFLSEIETLDYCDFTTCENRLDEEVFFKEKAKNNRTKVLTKVLSKCYRPFKSGHLPTQKWIGKKSLISLRMTLISLPWYQNRSS